MTGDLAIHTASWSQIQCRYEGIETRILISAILGIAAIVNELAHEIYLPFLGSMSG